MTVPATYTPASITANGVTTVFPYGFRILAEEDLQVTEDGVVVTTGFTISGVGEAGGGDVTYLVAPANGVVIGIRRAMAYKRDTDYQNLGDLRSDILNEDQDAPVMMIQQVAQDLQDLRDEFEAVDRDGIVETLATHTEQIAALDADVEELQARGVPDLEGYASSASTAIEEGKVLVFSKSSNPADKGALGASYMPAPRAYSPSIVQSAFADGFKFPSLHSNDDAGPVAVVLPASTETWPINVPQDFVQGGSGKFTIELADAVSGLYLAASTWSGSAVGTYNSVTGPQVRSTGPGAMFRIVRINATVFIATGNLEDVP